MNFLPIMIGVLLISMFSDKNGGAKKNIEKDNLLDVENIQNTIGAINSFNKLGVKDADKMGVVLELMSNPVVAELMEKFLGKSQSESGQNLRDDESENEQSFSQNEQKEFFENTFSQEPSDEDSSETDDLFKPVENIAGVEVSAKLKHLYNNWYTKK